MSAVGAALDGVLAKSPSRPGADGERLTAHLAATLAAARAVQDRIGVLAGVPDSTGGRFWSVVAWAALAHDAGKVADGFQQMVSGRSRTGWGQRHEVLSLGFLPGLVPTGAELDTVAVVVATHHRALSGSGEGSKPSLRQMYGGMTAAELADEMGRLEPERVGELRCWLADTAVRDGLTPAREASDRQAVGGPPCGGMASEVVGHAHRLLERPWETWGDTVDEDAGLAAVLVQGAVTLADHLSSAKGSLHTRQPFDAAYRARLQRRLAADGDTLRDHQRAAAETDGHLLLRAPTGSGKTEAGLLWAAA